MTDNENEMLIHLKNMFEMAGLVTFSAIEFNGKEKEHIRLMKNYRKTEAFIEKCLESEVDDETT